MRSWIALDAEVRAARILSAHPKDGQGVPLFLSKQSPESLPRSHPLHLCVTVGNALYGGKRVVGTGSNNEPCLGL